MRDFSQATKYAKDAPKFGEVVKRKFGRVRNYGGGGPSLVDVQWDLSPTAKAAQIFRMSFPMDGKTRELYLSRQELEHFLRAV